MKPSRLLTVILIVTSMMLSMSAEEGLPKKRRNLEIGIGFNTLGPAPQMAELMVEHGFDGKTTGLFFGGVIEYPTYGLVDFNTHISYSEYLGPKSQLGFLLHYSRLREVTGLSPTGGILPILFSNVSVVPLYKFGLSQFWEIQVGPALMLNSGRKTYLYDENDSAERDTELSLGLLSGLNLKIWDRKYTYGKIGTHYLLTTRNKMGPFTAKYLWENTTIPESKIGFSHLNFQFVFGFHLKDLPGK